MTKPARARISYTSDIPGFIGGNWEHHDVQRAGRLRQASRMTLFSVDTAVDGTAALEKRREKTFELVLTDGRLDLIIGKMAHELVDSTSLLLAPYSFEPPPHL